MEKDLLIHRVGLVPLPRQNSCPTVLYYTREGEALVGDLAYETAATEETIPSLNHDFKVALGNQSSRNLGSDLYPCADGEQRSAFKLTAEFLRYCLKQAANRISESGSQDAAHLMIAEPVSVHGEENGSWLADYRKNLRDLLRNKEFTDIPNIHFEEVEFLPEPLAVFNFYRYGFRHPNLAGQEKYRVLVLDVGGGTSDCSVIETTKDGDISKSGKNSKPFGASSETIGGHFLNHKLAEELMVEVGAPGKSKPELRKSLQRLLAFSRGKANGGHFSEEDWSLYENLQWVLYYVERAKKELARFVADHPNGWAKSDPPSKEVFIQVPENPFLPINDTRWVPVPLSSSTFRAVFEREIWRPHLKPLILRTLCNASQALDGRPVNRVILSGGTANIGWIGHWIRNDVPALNEATLIDIKADYQEVVAQGLAIECSRRFFSEEHVSDFQSVTYNPLALRIGVSGAVPEALDWKPTGDNVLAHDAGKNGMLIPAATDIRELCDKTLEWKLSAHTAVPREIEYYFYATADDESDGQGNPETRESARLNYEEFRLTAPNEAGFDSSLKLRLEIRSDGTAIATFLLRDGKHASAKEALVARPFHIDMTSSSLETNIASKTYVGLDFGSSNTAMALVSALEIEQYEIDSKDKGWIELTDLSPKLPLPVAEPLARYIEESGDASKRVRTARQTIESALSLLVAVLMADHQKQNGHTNGGAKHGPLQGFARSKVSAGPLWGCLKEYLKILGKKSSFSSPIRTLIDEASFSVIDQAVTAVADCKHDKIDESTVDWNRSLSILGNVVRKVFEFVEFGYFSNSCKRAGKSSAQFRTLNGSRYGDSGRTTELHDIPEDVQPYLFSRKDAMFIPLFPWVLFENGGDSRKRLCLFFDGADKKGNLTYRSPTQPGEKVLQASDDLSVYAHQAAALLQGRLEPPLINLLNIHEE